MNWFQKLLDIGVYPGLPKNFQLPVRTLNSLAYIGSLGTLCAILISIYHADPWGLYLVPLLGFGFVLGLNAKRKYYIAAVTEVLVSIGSVLIFGAASNNPAWYLCLLPPIVFPFFIFSVEDKKTALNMSLGSLLVYVAMELNSSEWVMPWIELGVGGGMLAFAHLSKRSNELVELALLEERATSERLLNNFLPEKIAKILRENGNKPPMIAERFDHVTVIFCDIVNFTPMSEKLSPEKLVAVLNQLFTEFDNLIEKYGLEKIKTIGDAYMVAGGVPNQMDNAEEASADFALEMLEVVKQFDRKFQHGLDMRIGMHCGPVVAGVIGKQKFTYDMWGDTVNVAARMESHGLPGEIHISEALADILKDKYLLAQRGWVEVKGKGLLQTFWIKQKEGGSSIASKHASKQPIASPNIDAKYTATKIDRDKDSVKKDAHRSSKTSQKSTSSPSPSSKQSRTKDSTIQSKKSGKKEARWAKRSVDGSKKRRSSRSQGSSSDTITSDGGRTTPRSVNTKAESSSLTDVSAKKKFWEK